MPGDLAVRLNLALSGRILFALVSILVGLVVAGFIFGGYLVSRQELERDFSYEARIYSETFYAMQRTIELELEQEARVFARDPAVQDILSAALRAMQGGDEAIGQLTALRQQLFELVAPRWLSDGPQAHSHHLHFYLGGEAVSFLRMHDPGRFGDRLVDQRHLLAQVVEQRQPRSGFEIGPTFAGIRSAVPVMADRQAGTKLLGTLEVGLSYATMVEQIGQVSGHDITVLLNSGVVEAIMGAEAVADQGAGTTPCGCLVHATSEALPSVVLDFAQRNGRGLFETSGEAQFMTRGERSYVASFFPLRDYQGHMEPGRRDIGSVVVWQDVTQRLAEFESAAKTILWLGVVCYLVIELLLYFALQRVAPGLRMEIRTTAEALERNVSLRQFFEQILDSVEESVFLINRSGGFEYVNQAAGRRLDQSRARLIQMAIGDIDVDCEAADWDRQWQSLEEAGTLVYESRFRDSAGSEFPVEITANHIHYQDAYYNLVLVRDISARKQFELALRDSDTRYRSIIATARDGFLATDVPGRIVEVNASYCAMLGYSQDELIGMRLGDIEVLDTQLDRDEFVGTLIEYGNSLYEAFHRDKNGIELPVEVSASYSSLDQGRVFLFVRDISMRKQDERISGLRDSLSSMVHQAGMNQVLMTALDEAEQMTRSSIAFYHFIDVDEETLTLQAWSSETLKNNCNASPDDIHYPVSEAGVWVDCVRQRRPLIHNDYPSLAHRKGLPDGHVALTRLATVPVFRDGRIVAAVGVGNKTSPYDQRDLSILSRIADMSYDFARHCETKQHVEFMAYYDMLTGLPNRELFFERLKQNIAQHDRTDNLLALCYLDLDGFKPINDEHGHGVGDELLIKLGARLQAMLREGDTLARIGGDEFLVMLTGLTAAREAERIVKRLINETSKPFDIEDKRLYVTASIGVTLYPTDDTNPDTLLRHADQAMYQAKALGKSRYSLYELVEEENQRARREIQGEVHKGLSDDQFVLWYQPRVELSSNRVVGVEALIRWRHPSKGLLPPGAFLPYIAGTADDVALGEWVVGQALDRIDEWRRQGIDLPVSINISPNHIQNGDFAVFLRESLARYPAGLAGLVELEILETAAIGDIDHVVSVMNECIETGISFSLDDFGTGYSSLTYFHQLPVSVLKIDQNFVRNMIKDAGALEIVKGVLQLARTLKRPVVAEGVESRELGLMLLGLGCELVQGYGVARPMPEDALMHWLAQWTDGTGWTELQRLSQYYSCDVELQVAMYSLWRWCASVLRYVESLGDSEVPILNEEKSPFGSWLHGIGRVRYGDHALYPFIAPRYSMLHKLARDVVAYVDHNDKHAALSLMVVFHNSCDELRTKVAALESD